MDYTVHGILQARILEWVAFPFSKGSSQSRDQTQVSRIVGPPGNSKFSHVLYLRFLKLLIKYKNAWNLKKKLKIVYIFD